MVQHQQELTVVELVQYKIEIMKIYRNDIEINIDHILITDFGDIVNEKKEIKKDNQLDFSSIKTLMGDKYLLELSFQDELKYSLTHG
jgi:uncharacterized transporter YbjL